MNKTIHACSKTYQHYAVAATREYALFIGVFVPVTMGVDSDGGGGRRAPTPSVVRS